MTTFANSKTRRSDVTYWEQNGFDEYGMVTVREPVAMKVRIEKSLRNTLDLQGNNVATTTEQDGWA